MESAKEYSNALLRMKNRGQVFKELVTNNGVLRMELAERCGLSKMTISYIVNEFLEKDFAVETVKNGEQKLGRKSTVLRLSPGAKKIVGLGIQRDRICAALCDCQLNIIRTNSVSFTECDLDFLMKTAFALTDEMMEGNEILGIGIGSIGPVNFEKGMILNPPQFYGIHDVPIAQMFREHYGLPVYLDYHYNCAARAEKYFGVGKDYKNFYLLGLKEGLGIAIVVDGKILTRMVGVSSELGHMTVDINGVECGCKKRGCVGNYMHFENSEATWGTLEILCTALSGVCDLIPPQAVIVREEQSSLSNEHLSWMEERLNEMIQARDYQRIKVLRSYRNKELEASGCAANVLGRVFSGEIEI